MIKENQRTLNQINGLTDVLILFPCMILAYFIRFFVFNGEPGHIGLSYYLYAVLFMAPLFWLAVVVLGVAVPFAATLAQRRGLALAASGEAVARSRAAVTLGVAALCMVVAVIAFRVIMFSLGSSIIDFEFTL